MAPSGTQFDQFRTKLALNHRILLESLKIFNICQLCAICRPTDDLGILHFLQFLQFCIWHPAPSCSSSITSTLLAGPDSTKCERRIRKQETLQFTMTVYIASTVSIVQKLTKKEHVGSLPPWTYVCGYFSPHCPSAWPQVKPYCSMLWMITL